MRHLVGSQAFWLLVVIHVLLIIAITYFKIFKPVKLLRNRVFPIENMKTENKTEYRTDASNYQTSLKSYIPYPKFSSALIFKTIKLNHVFIKNFKRDYSLWDRVLDTVSGTILLVGILGISGSLFNAWPHINFLLAGVFGGLLARVFHSWYSTLQERQKKIPNEFSSSSKLVMMVEAEVIARLNIHRNMRRVFGYFIMILYYAINFYYCIVFLLNFDSTINFYWSLSFIAAVIFEFLILELLIILVKIEALKFMKVGGIIETICRIILNDDFLKTIN